MSSPSRKVDQKNVQAVDMTFCSAGEARSSNYATHRSNRWWCIGIIVVAVDIPFGIIQTGWIKPNRVSDSASWQRCVGDWD
jgi:hypothetical protein